MGKKRIRKAKKKPVSHQAPAATSDKDTASSSHAKHPAEEWLNQAKEHRDKLRQIEQRSDSAPHKEMLVINEGYLVLYDLPRDKLLEQFQHAQSQERVHMLKFIEYHYSIIEYHHYLFKHHQRLVKICYADRQVALNSNFTRIDDLLEFTIKLIHLLAQDESLKKRKITITRKGERKAKKYTLQQINSQFNELKEKLNRVKAQLGFGLTGNIDAFSEMLSQIEAMEENKCIIKKSVGSEEKIEANIEELYQIIAIAAKTGKRMNLKSRPDLKRKLDESVIKICYFMMMNAAQSENEDIIMFVKGLCDHLVPALCQPTSSRSRLQHFYYYSKPLAKYLDIGSKEYQATDSTYIIIGYLEFLSNFAQRIINHDLNDEQALQWMVNILLEEVFPCQIDQLNKLQANSDKKLRSFLPYQAELLLSFLDVIKPIKQASPFQKLSRKKEYQQKLKKLENLLNRIDKEYGGKLSTDNNSSTDQLSFDVISDYIKNFNVFYEKNNVRKYVNLHEIIQIETYLNHLKKQVKQIKRSGEEDLVCIFNLLNEIKKILDSSELSTGNLCDLFTPLYEEVRAELKSKKLIEDIEKLEERDKTKTSKNRKKRKKRKKKALQKLNNGISDPDTSTLISDKKQIDHIPAAAAPTNSVEMHHSLGSPALPSRPAYIPENDSAKKIRYDGLCSNDKHKVGPNGICTLLSAHSIFPGSPHIKQTRKLTLAHNPQETASIVADWFAKLEAWKVLCSGLSAISADIQIYVIGGAVRDRLFSKVPADYDLVTNASLAQLRTALECKDIPFQEIATYEKYQLIKVIIGSTSLDISYGKALTKKFWQKDAKNRDFTINTFRINPHEHTPTILSSFPHAANDADAKLIKVVIDGNLEEIDSFFAQDPIRILRAIRFAIKLGCQLDEKIKNVFNNDTTFQYLYQIDIEKFKFEADKLQQAYDNASYLEQEVETYNEKIMAVHAIRVGNKAPRQYATL